MREAHLSRSTLLKWLLIGAGWALFAFFFASEVFIARVYQGRPGGFGRPLLVWLICAALWFATTPLITWLARRFPLDRQSWWSSVLVHLGAAALISFVLLALYVQLVSLLGIETQQTFWPALRSQLVISFHSEVLTYWMVVGLCHGIDYYRKYRERELRASQLEARLAQAQLDALKMQLQPHFLFNTLNSISVLMSEDVTAARRMLTRLGDLLRTSLENAGQHEVALSEELRFLRSYLEIEETRFHDRLRVNIQVDPELLDARVPNLILQPLVENAIRHGIAPRAESGLVEIQATRENGRMRLSVRDDGPGLGTNAPEQLMKGIGLSNTQARLEQLYGDQHEFEVRNANGRGLEVVIAIPFRNGIASDRR
jgi:two-component system, LytTR family, sensor kinase